MIGLGLVMFVPHFAEVVMVIYIYIYIYWGLYHNYYNEE